MRLVACLVGVVVMAVGVVVMAVLPDAAVASSADEQFFASDGATFDGFGVSDAGTVVVGAAGNDDAGSESGSAYARSSVVLQVPTDLVFDLPDGSAEATLRPMAGNPLRLEIAGATFENTSFRIPTNSLTISGGSGVDSVTIVGVDLGAASLSVSAEQIVVDSGSELSTTGDVTLAATAVGSDVAAVILENVGIEANQVWLTASGGSGVDSVTIVGVDLGAASLSVSAEQIVVDSGTELSTTGDVTLAATAADGGGFVGPGVAVPSYVTAQPLSVESFASAADAAVILENAAVEANQIWLTAAVTSDVADTGEPFSHVRSEATATVAVSDSSLTSFGDIVIESEVSSTASNQSQGLSGENVGADGAVASIDVVAVSTSSVSGSTVVNAGGALSVSSSSDVDANSSGEAQFGTAGGGVAITKVSQTTQAFIDTDSVAWTAESVFVGSTADDTISTSSFGSPDGSDLADALAGRPTPDQRTAGNANAIPNAAALAYTEHLATTEAYIQGGVTITTTGAQVVEARSNHNTSATADASTVATAATGTGNAIAVNAVDATTDAWVGSSAELVAPGGVTVAAPVAGVFDASAIPGQGAGVNYDTLQSNLVSNAQRATLRPGASLVAGAISVLADTTTTLELVGDTINDSGGTAGPEQWSLSAVGSEGVPGSFGLSQVGPEGYALTSLSCDNAEGEVTSVLLAIGADVVCTFVNDDLDPSVFTAVGSCVVGDSSSFGPLDGLSVSVFQVSGALPLGQGAEAGSCGVPAGADAVLVNIAAVDPLIEGNFRASAQGVPASGGVVNFAALSPALENSNAVVVPLSAAGALQIEVNCGGPCVLPTADVRLTVLGFFDEPSGAVDEFSYVPVTPCAAFDSRANQGATGGFVGPYDAGEQRTFQISGSFAAGQGGGNTDCGVPSGASAVMVNLVALNSAVSGDVAIGAGGSDPVEPVLSHAPLSPQMNNANAVIVPLDASGQLVVEAQGSLGATDMAEMRGVVLGYLTEPDDGAEYFPVAPCAAFDSRSNQGATGGFAGAFVDEETRTYAIGGVFDAAQGGGNTTCGVPVGADAVLINLVAINASLEGNLRVAATGTVATGGVVNFASLTPSMNNSNAIIVPLSALGQLDVTANLGVISGVPGVEVRGVVLGYLD